MPFLPTIFDDASLEGLCEYLSRTEYVYYPEATSYFFDLYKTGCRPLELLTIGLWTYNSPTDIRLQPMKGNTTRYFIETELSSDLVFSIIGNYRPYFALSYRQLKAVLYKIIPVISVATNNKSAIDYMFRYNLTRQLSINGMSDTDIALKFGWSTAARATAYRTEPLYYTGTLPPFADNVLIDNYNNFLIDGDGTFIEYI